MEGQSGVDPSEPQGRTDLEPLEGEVGSEVRLGSMAGDWEMGGYRQENGGEERGSQMGQGEGVTVGDGQGGFDVEFSIN